jgi:putative flippase GtrA
LASPGTVLPPTAKPPLPRAAGAGLAGHLVLTLKYSAASCCGFAVDAVLLKLGLILGLEPAWARAISLVTAMQVTFCINGLLVFRNLEPGRIHRQWAGYMATNALGNLCNYLVFTTLLSLHSKPWSGHMFALSCGAFTAWLLNYASTRWLVFRRRKPAVAPAALDTEPASRIQP